MKVKLVLSVQVIAYLLIQTIEITHLAPNLQKKIAPRSKASNHFDKYVESVIDKAKCMYCHQSFAYNSSNGTTELN